MTEMPYSPARASKIDDARSASAAIVSDGFKQSEVGTLDTTIDSQSSIKRRLFRGFYQGKKA